MKEASVGRLVRWARRRSGMTQHDLARAVGMPQSSVARIERGTVIPRTATLIAILAATGNQLTTESIGPAVDEDAIRRRLALAVPARTWQALGRRPARSPTTPTRLLRQLRLSGVPFILVGELAEVAHGSPHSWGGVIEVVHPGNAAALGQLAPAHDDLTAAATNERRLRLLAETSAGDDYGVLARTSVRMLIDTGLLVRVAAIEDLIRDRLARCTAEDRAVATVLRAIADLP